MIFDVFLLYVKGLVANFFMEEQNFSDNIDFFARRKDNEEAQNFFSYLQEWHNTIFLTWKAWSWKSTLIQDTISFFKNENKYPLILWSTWISALNIGGQTVHSFFSLGIDEVYYKDIQYYLKDKAQKKYKLKKSKVELLLQSLVVIIDEVSMLSSNVLDSIDFLMRFYLALRTKNKELTKIPFGWKKMIFVWDVFQLPPVKTEKWIEKFADKYESEWFFDSNVFKKLVDKDLWKTVILKKNYRQWNDQSFQNILDNIRDNNISFEDIDLLNKCIKNSKNIEDSILLSTHRNRVDVENKTRLSLLPWSEKIFKSQTVWQFPDYLKRADDELILKKWAKVMMLTNDPAWCRVNWSIGEVVGFDDWIIFVNIRWKVYPIGQNTWENKDVNINEDWKINENIVWYFVQYPLKLAYAITIHKSQWMTFDSCKIDISHVFSGWQVYTALSRVKTLSGLCLINGIKMRDLYFDKRVYEFVKKYMITDSK